MGGPFDGPCPKCMGIHIICPACWDLRRISASQADRYLNQLEEELK